MASSISQKSTGGAANMTVDYVVIYKYKDSSVEDATTQLRKLLEVLASVGLATEVRQGEDQSLLVFVKLASDDALAGQVYRSRIKDWLHNVRSSAPDKQSLEREPLYPAERLRIVHQLITEPPSEGGAGIMPKHGEWKNVDAIFTLHDHEFNKKWLKHWTTKYMLDVKDLDQIRDAFGEKVAYYFAFTQSYFTALLGVAVFGVSAWALLGHFSAVYAVCNGLLCVAFVEWWKHQEEDLAIRWGVKGVSRIESKRNDFAPEREITDPVTGEQALYFPAPKRFQRQLLQVPFVVIAAIILGTLIATCFGIEIFVSEVYNGPGQSMLVFLPTVILSTCQPLILGLLTSLAERLNKFENYETHAAYETAMTQKIFILNFITSYSPIFLTAFVYLPFANVLVPYLDVFSLTVQPFAENKKQMTTPQQGAFQVNPNRLRKQVIYFTVTAQVVNQVLEVVVPYLKRRGMAKAKEIKSSRAAQKGGASASVADNDTPEEVAFLKRVRKEAELDDYDVTGDFREMVVQYGYLVLFSVVWPLTSLSFLINNWIELRTDAVKICVESRRPSPDRADTIGPWLHSLEFLTWVGSISTAALIYMFRGGDETSRVEDSLKDVKLWGLLLSIIFSEHVFLLVRFAVGNFVSKIDSESRQKSRAEQYAVRKRYLEESLGVTAGGAASAKEKEQSEFSRQTLEDEARQGSLTNAGPEERFWRRQRGWQESADVGSTWIKRDAAESENKKSR